MEGEPQPRQSDALGLAKISVDEIRELNRRARSEAEKDQDPRLQEQVVQELRKYIKEERDHDRVVDLCEALADGGLDDKYMLARVISDIGARFEEFGAVVWADLIADEDPMIADMADEAIPFSGDSGNGLDWLANELAKRLRANRGTPPPPHV